MKYVLNFHMTDILCKMDCLSAGVCDLQHQAFPQSRNAFKVGMKLEGLDPCHPAFFCVLTVAEVTHDQHVVCSYWERLNAFYFYTV